jgi:pyruvate/2-oxoglutarate dehydrogenase complex dihydrolipoamide acyltransferase (E2) component
VSDTATTVVVPMPHMGVSVEEGTVIEWLKAVGEEVAAEEVICAIATDKVDVEVEAPAAGVLAKIVAEAGETVAVGEPIGELAVGAEAATAEVADSARIGSGFRERWRRSALSVRRGRRDCPTREVCRRLGRRRLGVEVGCRPRGAGSRRAG